MTNQRFQTPSKAIFALLFVLSLPTFSFSARPSDENDEVLGSLDYQRKLWRDESGETRNTAGGIVLTGTISPACGELGKPLTLVLSLWNVNNETVWHIARPYVLPSLNLALRDTDGRFVPYTEIGRNTWVGHHAGNASMVEIDIPPACAIGAQLRLEKYFDISRACKYTLLVTTNISGCDVSTTIPLEVKLSAQTKQLEPPHGDLIRSRRRIPWDASFDQQWGAAMGLAGESCEGLTLRSQISPVDRQEVNLAVALTNDAHPNIDAIDGGARFWRSRALLPRQEIPEVKLPAGNMAADYELLVRDSDRRPVPMMATGRLFLQSHKGLPLDPLRPGEAVGFVFPLDRMFPLKPGGAYTVLAAVTTSEADSDVWVSAPVVIHVPEKPLVGTTRPAYGSPYYIAALQRTSREDVKLTSSVEHQIDNVFLATTLVSSDGHPIKPWLRSTDCKDAMLVFLLDDQGQPVLRNGNARAAPFCWSTGYDPVLRQATDMRNLLALDCQGGGRLSYFYSLRGGRRYSLFCASYLTGEPQGMVVARPIRFTMPTADEGRRYPLKTGRDQRVVLRTSADVMPPAIPDRNEQWKMFERFAGKSFENLRLDASITDEHESSSRPLIMNVALTNCSNESVGLTKWKGSAGFIIHVRDSSNREIELSESGKKLLGDTVAPTTCHLGPGNTVQARLPIKGLFDLRTPGDYTVLVSLPVLGDVDAVLTAAPVKLSVVAKPAEARK